ncbi:hypothetical protein NHL50_12785 [Acidimicrobiia bacterium EGI L10123]|uniref:hypothetical protein n=1 Tax=Salinilacustrithrix flava TaxID=2957203 RepID=UPI003D7C350E|nr:hypothetical protein [Acidimicrobiia bacterium EGI L10123]
MASKYRVNDDGVAKARQMIDSNQYDLETEWGDAAPSSEQSNEKIDRDGYDGYGEWHLALDTEASEETKDRYAFPFGDFHRVVRSGLIAAKQRAAQNEHDAVEKAADELLAHLDGVRS